MKRDRNTRTHTHIHSPNRAGQGRNVNSRREKRDGPDHLSLGNGLRLCASGTTLSLCILAQMVVDTRKEKQGSLCVMMYDAGGRAAAPLVSKHNTFDSSNFRYPFFVFFFFNRMYINRWVCRTLEFRWRHVPPDTILKPLGGKKAQHSLSHKIGRRSNLQLAHQNDNTTTTTTTVHHIPSKYYGSSQKEKKVKKKTW